MKTEKNLTVGIFENGSSFGEPPLFIDQPYPASAVAADRLCALKTFKS